MSAEIDDSLYSRQRYVLGDEAMMELKQAAVLIIGMGGLGLEIAKNVILSGPKKLTICDWRNLNNNDLSGNFYAQGEDIGKNRVHLVINHLKQLNPYVHVDCCDWSGQNVEHLKPVLSVVDCVVVTECHAGLVSEIDSFCRTQTSPIRFIDADVYGVIGWVFCDFGPDFAIVDLSGEEPVEVFISDISQAEHGIVTTMVHNLRWIFSDEHSVTFREIQGMTELNGCEQEITIINDSQFSIGDTSKFNEYLAGGIAVQVKNISHKTYESFEVQLSEPSIEPTNSEHLEMINHAIMKTLLTEHSDSFQLSEMVDETKAIMKTDLSKHEEEYLENILRCCQGCFPPLYSIIGGIAAQEVLKAVTHKFQPLNQWIFFDAVEVCEQNNNRTDSKTDINKYSALESCIGEQTLCDLQQAKLFMVGCGAIGCELLKCFALLGCGTGDGGEISIVDDDMIEKTNLNRQFLFRPEHIRQSKAAVARETIIKMNKDMNINEFEMKVCEETEQEMFHDQFFQSLDAVVTALDSLEARLYVDRRCVTNGRSMFDSGTMGTKGSTQVVLPHLTQCYSEDNKVEPVNSYPVCTLKSFPERPEHVVQWARNKFESQFNSLSAVFNKFWDDTSPESLQQTDLADSLHQLQIMPSEKTHQMHQAVKILLNRPTSYSECVSQALIMFEKYFNHKAQQLLHSFPPTTRRQNGMLFWKPPRRLPVAQKFSIRNSCHMRFIESTAKLMAKVYGVTQDQNISISHIVETTPIPEFSPSNKIIASEESEIALAVTQDGLRIPAILEKYETWLRETDSDIIKTQLPPLNAIQFEKDDNLHIDFIESCSNLRNSMYNMDEIDRFKAKQIAGNIIPAIATTTACVAGLTTIELIKYFKYKNDLKTDLFQNCSFNLGISSFAFRRPAHPAVKSVGGHKLTVWSTATVTGSKTWTLQDLLVYVMGRYNNVEVPLVQIGTHTVVYNSVLPSHQFRLQKKMDNLLSSVKTPFICLTVSLRDPNAQLEVTEEYPRISVLYHFGNN